MKAVRRNFAKILSLLSAPDRRHLYGLALVMVVMGLLEVAGIGSILPFIAAVANMDTVLANRYLRYLYDLLGFGSRESFVIFLGSAVLALLITRNLFFAVANWLVSRFTFRWRRNLSQQLLDRYLMQPYAWFLTRNTVELRRKVLSEAERVVGTVILPGIQVVTSAIISTCIVTLLFVIDHEVALVVTGTLGGSYLLLYGLVYRKLSRLSQKAQQARRTQFKVASEAFDGIKELKLFGKEGVFVEEYSRWARRNARLETISRAISQVPRYGIEMLAVSGVMGFILYLVATRQNLSPWMPILVVYVVSGYRMLPAMQQIFSGFTTMQYNIPILDALHADFTGLHSAPGRPPSADSRPGFGRIDSIALHDVAFRYPQGADPAISNLDLLVERNTTVGLVGPTGSGKTTLVDIVMGLLKPLAGELAVNGIAVTPGNVADWQARIGYVPQHIFLFDDTVARNVAFGVPDAEIDYAALEKALKIANLHDYVMHALPDGYDSVLGQRGIRLSGGQMQRIGIARALYRNPEILVLDEATSALDGVTESAVMDAIQRLSHKLTIIIIAHRLNTVRNCDIIHFVDNGRVICSGSYTDLADSCGPFQAMLHQSRPK
jgi:ATP-binding cassette, subfamily B, bacterial PglK